MVRLILMLVLLAAPVLAQDRDTLRLKLVLDPREAAPIEGEMILATIRGIYRETITNEELKLRDMTDFDWTRLGQDAWTDERIDGRMAKVFERRIALYPKRAGTLEVLPIAHELQIISIDGVRSTVLVRSDPVRLEVQAKPEGAGDDWFPVRALEISDSWDVDAARLVDGQSVERRVVLRALGATPEMMPPQPALREPWLITFTPPEERDFQVTPQGPVTTLTWRWTLRPITGEPGVLPAVTIPYFDTAARTARTVTLPAAPIGYASFADNAARGWRKDLGVGWPHLMTGAAVCLLVLALALRDRGLPTHLRDRLERRRMLRRLRRYARAGDAEGFRLLAARLLNGAGPHADLRDMPVLATLDRALFGHARTAPPPLGALYGQVKRETAACLRNTAPDGRATGRPVTPPPSPVSPGAPSGTVRWPRRDAR